MPEALRSGAPSRRVREVAEGLSGATKELPPKFFYDQRGSELFEEITRQPEYYLTRTERALLAEWMPRWIGEIRPRTVLELGAGSARKTRIVLDAMANAMGTGVYVALDISADFLDDTARALRQEYPSITVETVVADLTSPIHLPFEVPRPALIGFLGSTIGNQTREGAVALLRHARALMGKGDRFLLGVDLRKDRAVLEAAYNDANGVTAEFNLNILRVLNEEMGADFDVSAFRHRAFYNEPEHRIEMHLVSARPQTVTIPGAGRFSFREGETIRTEISSKYDRASMRDIFRDAGFGLTEWATDPDELYALALAAP